MKTTFCNYVHQRCHKNLSMLPAYTISIPMIEQALKENLIQIFQQK